MKYTIGFLILFLWFFACGKINEKISLEEIRKLEYSRNSDSQKFVSFLNNRDPLVRLTAVEAFGRIQDTSKVILLANRLKDEDESVRKAAAFALGELFSPLAEDYLIDAIKLDPSEGVRTEIIEALGKSGTEKSFKILKDYLESDKRTYEESASIACGILAYRGFPPINNAFSLEILLNAGKNNDVRWRSAYSLFRIASPASFKNVYKQINYEESPLVRYFVIRALSAMLEVMRTPEFKEFQSYPKMSEALQLSKSPGFYDTAAKMLNDSTWYVRAAVVQMLGILGNRFFQDEIINATKDDHPYVEIAAIRSLANFKNSSSIHELKRIFQSDLDWQLRGEALLALSELDLQQSLNIVEFNLSKFSWPKNYFLIKTLERIKDRNYVEKSTNLLMKLASDGEVAQRTLALEALVDRTEVPVEFMLEKLSSADPAITTIVATHFTFRKTAQAAESLMDVYKNFTAPKDIEAMKAIITALDSIKSTRAVPFLEAQLNNPYPAIQQSAQKALINITGNNDIEIPKTADVYLANWNFDLNNYKDNPIAEILTTKGKMVIELFPEKAPVTVANFITLSQKGFYNNIYFHRVVPGYVIQGGDPRGDGWGGPGYTIPCEYNDLFFGRGIVGIADAGKDTGGSQFFITQLPQPHLNGRYTAFGKVIKGMDVVDQIIIFDKINNIEIKSENKLVSN